jgi:thiamine-phosphate pyrophosphorylase
MQTRPVLCYVTDRQSLRGGESALLDKLGEAARAGVDFVQLREKDLGGRALENLALAARDAIRRNSPRDGESQTKLLVNARVDVALAVGADGVHLPSRDLSVAEVRAIWKHARPGTSPMISAACHTVVEVRTAAEADLDFTLFAPVFAKKDAAGVAVAGLEILREACRATVPVLALGGVTLANARACLQAGAAGIAGIRLFQDQDIATVVRELRG